MRHVVGTISFWQCILSATSWGPACGDLNKGVPRWKGMFPFAQPLPHQHPPRAQQTLCRRRAQESALQLWLLHCLVHGPCESSDTGHVLSCPYCMVWLLHCVVHDPCETPGTSTGSGRPEEEWLDRRELDAGHTRLPDSAAPAGPSAVGGTVDRVGSGASALPAQPAQKADGESSAHGGHVVKPPSEVRIQPSSCTPWCVLGHAMQHAHGDRTAC